MGLFMSPPHPDPLAALGGGPPPQPRRRAPLIGESGTGKTTLVCALLARQYRDVRAAYLGNPKLSFTELMGSILSQLGVRGGRANKAAMINAFAHYAADLPLNERIAILVDEAQVLSDDALEELRLLSNLERHGRKAAQIVLAGQYELGRRLAQPEMHHFNERIGARAVLSPLSPLECRQYVEHRLGLCGTTAEKIFVSRALDLIVRESAGIPRRINALCHNALLLAYSGGVKRVTAAMAREAAAEYGGAGTADQPRREPGWVLGRINHGVRSIKPVLGLAALGIAGFVSGQLFNHNPAHRLGAWAAHRAGAVDTYAQLTPDIDPKIQLRPASARAALQPSGDEALATTVETRPALPDHGSSIVKTELSSSASPAPAPAAGEGAASAASIKNPAPAAVAAPPADAEAPRPSHRFVVVARGDTLSTIAIRHLGSLSAVRSLMRLNPHITDAGHVYPGEKVYLPAAAPVASTENPDDSDVE